MDTLEGLFLSLLGAVQRDHGGFEVCRAPVPLNGAEVDTRFEQMGGLGMPKGMRADVALADTGALFGCATRALDAAAGHGGGGAGICARITG
jgi:hypothetical protein